MALPFRKNLPPQKPKHLINNNIRFRKIMLIDSNGQKFGDTSTSEALEIAQREGLDLVIINEKSEIPVAKIMDYGKYLYEQKRKTRESKKKATNVKVKSIRLKPQISDHDLSWKADQAISWLSEGDRVQFIIRAYGRIRTKIDLIEETFNKFTKLVEKHGVVQGKLKKLSDVMYEALFLPVKNSQNSNQEKEKQDGKN